MALFFISFLAGALTVLAPCILPLLPVVIGTSVGTKRTATPYVVIGSLAASILLFTYLLKASTALIAIPPSFWSYLSGGILAAFGLILIVPSLWERLPIVAKSNRKAQELMSAGHQKQSYWGDALIGAALGPVFSSCSPTYFVILATVLPASFALGTLYLLAYLAGLVLVLALIAVLGQRLTVRLGTFADSRGLLKKGLGVLFIVLGIAIIAGYDKKFETWVLDQGYLSGVIEFENELLKSVEPTPMGNDRDKSSTTNDPAIELPLGMERQFPDTDFSKTDQVLTKAISGGPSKDGIPSIDNPSFIPLSEFTRSDDVQAIVMEEGDSVRVYPYNILIWHEIVNDTVGGTPVAVTFCPLCGSAIVFDRTLPDGTVSTFGVSGYLLESNMIMYDRATENLWQQSTGDTLAGSFHPASLSRVEFQLLTLGDVRQQYPHAEVLSEDTGYQRDYARNPYAGYETSDRFIFDPSSLDTTVPPKTVMVVFTANDTTFAAPWLALREAGTATITHNGRTYTLTATDSGELTITDDAGTTYPFYFEMWFSVSVQNENVVRITVTAS